MASSGKRKTTMAKINRERKLRERRSDKQARKVARRQEAEFGPPDSTDTLIDGDEDGLAPGEPESLEPLVQSHIDA
jgi:hypothetical protein